MCPTPKKIAALPFRWPARLADGLELEVFYVTCLNCGFTIRPVFRVMRNIWFPRVARCTNGSGDFGRH